MAITNDIISYTEARNNLKAVMDKVWDDSAPVVITRSGGKPVVMMSKEEYDSLCETEYLTSTKANKKALDDGLKQIAGGKTVVMKFDKAGRLVRAD
jgi:antitoxin YefM